MLSILYEVQLSMANFYWQKNHTTGVFYKLKYFGGVGGVILRLSDKLKYSGDIWYAAVF